MITSAPLPAGERQDLPGVVRLPMVQHMMGALLAHERQAALRPCGTDDVQAAGSGDLNRGDADTAAGAVHEHRFAGAGARLVEERAPRGPVRHADRCALLKRDAVRQAMHLRVVADRQLGVAARTRRDTVCVDAIALLERRHVGADRFHDTGDIGSRCVGKVRLASVSPGADVGLHRVDADRLHPDEDLRRPRCRFGHVFDLHHVRWTELAHDDSVHECSLKVAGRGSWPLVWNFTAGCRLPAARGRETAYRSFHQK